MALPIILITGASSGAGTPGQDKYLTAGELVTLSDTEPLNAGASYTWTILSAPIGAGTVLAGAATATPTFTAPALAFAGTVYIKCVVDGEFEGTTRAAVVTSVLGFRIPALEERAEWNESGNTEGWHEALTNGIRTTDSTIATAQSDITALQTAVSTAPGVLVETIEPGSSVSSVTFSGLDGNADYHYRMLIRWSMITPSAARLAFRPNGLTTNQAAIWQQVTSLGTSTTTASLMIAGVCTSNDSQLYTVDFEAVATPVGRMASWRGGSTTGVAAATQILVTGHSVWTDTSTNLTSLTVACVDGAGALVASGISNRSSFSLYRYTR